MTRRDPTGTILRFSLLTAALALGAIACAASGADESGSDEIATLKDTALTTDGSTEQPELPSPTTTEDDSSPEMSVEDAQLEFAACMRETYPQWPDPRSDGGFGGRAALEELGIDPLADGFADVLDACRSNLQGVVGGTDLTAEEQAELQDNVLAVFACVRAHPGLENIPDPEFGTGTGRGFGMLELFRSGEINPAEFRAAIQDCAAEMGLEQPPGGQRRTGGGRLGGNAS